MVGMGMIFDDTYRPMFETLQAEPLYRRDFGIVEVELAAVATRTGARARAYRERAGDRIADFVSTDGPDAIEKMIAAGVDFVCVASPDNRHFDAARLALEAGCHVLI
jgi:predicted dehydrogenase